MQGIALEGPAEGAGGLVPMPCELVDAASPLRVRRIAGAAERLAFQNTEPDLDLIEPGRVQRQELEADAAGLSGEPSVDRGSCMNRQIVENDDEAAMRPPAPDPFQQVQEFAAPPAPTHVHHHPAAPDVPGGEDGQRPMPAILVFDPLRGPGAHRSAWVQPFEDLNLRLFVDAHDARPPGRPQIPAHDPADLAPKLGVRTVQPPLHPMRFESGGLQPSCDRTLADRRPDVAPAPNRFRQGAHGPVRPGRRQLFQGMAGQPDQFMPLFGGKTSGGAPSAKHREGRRAVRAQSARASGGPTCDPDRSAPRYSTPRRPHWRGAPPERGPQATTRCAPSAAIAAMPSAPVASTRYASPTPISWAAGYLTAGLPWGRTFGTRY